MNLIYFCIKRNSNNKYSTKLASSYLPLTDFGSDIASFINHYPAGTEDY